MMLKSDSSNDATEEKTSDNTLKEDNREERVLLAEEPKKASDSWFKEELSVCQDLDVHPTDLQVSVARDEVVNVLLFTDNKQEEETRDDNVSEGKSESLQDAITTDQVTQISCQIEDSNLFEMEESDVMPSVVAKYNGNQAARHMFDEMTQSRHKNLKLQKEKRSVASKSWRCKYKHQYVDEDDDENVNGASQNESSKQSGRAKKSHKAMLKFGTKPISDVSRVDPRDRTELELENRSFALEERVKVGEAAKAEMGDLEMQANNYRKEIEEKREEWGLLRKSLEECSIEHMSKTGHVNELVELLRKTQVDLERAKDRCHEEQTSVKIETSVKRVLLTHQLCVKMTSSPKKKKRHKAQEKYPDDVLGNNKGIEMRDEFDGKEYNVNEDSQEDKEVEDKCALPNERPNISKNRIAYQVFDIMLPAADIIHTSLKTQKLLKSWRFKFKSET